MTARCTRRAKDPPPAGIATVSRRTGCDYDAPRRSGGGDMFEHTITVIELMLIAILYMLPTLIAYARDIPARQTITVINIILGWTLIVWVIVFIWAMSAQTSPEEA
jgi:hypothetical protein